MCGIVGVVSKKSRKLTWTQLEVFKDALIADSIRGEDSTGIFSANDAGNIEYLKLATHPYNLVRSTDYTKFMNEAFQQGRLVVGHNRKATQGAINNKNTHPCIFGQIALMHNGSIDNFRSLLPIREREKHGVEVDSQVAAILLARNNPEDVLKEISGAFTFVWYNTKEQKLYFVRNEERPLAFFHNEDSVFFASEYLMLKWLLDRRNIKATGAVIKAGHLLTFDFTHDFNWSDKEIQLAKKHQSFSGGNLPSRVDHSPSKREVKNVCALTAKLKQSNILDSLPEESRYNIHYGEDYFVDPKAEHQQLVWVMDDYKPIDEAHRAWMAWGHARNSEMIQVKTNIICSEEEIEAMSEALYLIGFVRRATAERVTGEQWMQKIVVVQPRICSMTFFPSPDEKAAWHPLTQEHLQYLLKTSRCACGNEMCIIDQSPDKKLEDSLFLERIFNKNTLICKWCKDSGVQPEKKDETTSDIAEKAG